MIHVTGSFTILIYLFHFQSYTLNITTVQGFETFMSSLQNKTFRPSKGGCGVDLVLSCVDNYEARMVVNQVTVTTRKGFSHFFWVVKFENAGLLCLIHHIHESRGID